MSSAEELKFMASERRAIDRLKLFSVTTLFGTGLATLNLISGGIFRQFWFVNFVLELIGGYFFWTVLRNLSGFDKKRFGLPKNLTLGILFGLPIIAVGYAIALSSFGPTVGKVDLSLLLIGAVTLLIGATASLVGIGGEAIGLWRIGSKYNNISLKQGSVLFFIPFVGVIGAGLLIRGSFRTNPLPSYVVPEK